MKSNFDFLQRDIDTQDLQTKAREAEKLYAQKMYAQELNSIRVIIENVAKKILDFNYYELPNYSTLNDSLHEIKARNLVTQNVLDVFYSLKRLGNKASHELEGLSQGEGLDGLKQLDFILVWFANTYMDQNESTANFFEPLAEPLYSTTERKLIYIQTARNENNMWPAYSGSEKIGDASIDSFEINGHPNSDDLREVAERRINQYMNTAGVPHELQWAELAYRKSDKTWFRDYDVHEVLKRSGIKQNKNITGDEWYLTNTETVRKAIAAVKAGKNAIDVESSVKPKKIVLRPEQKAAVEQTTKVFKSKPKMLWNAKMRFGKTLSALQLIKNEKFQKVLITTHRPVVSDSWFDDFNKIDMAGAGYRYGSKTSGYKLEDLVDTDTPFIYFASLQDLRGSKYLGDGTFDKDKLVADTKWELVIVDEAHEGTQTDDAKNVFDAIVSSNTKVLELSGTPFNLMEKYDEDQVYTWDYVMEQQAKKNWSVEHPEERNPYETLPKVSMYTFEMKQKFNDSDFVSFEDKAFNFKEFFRVTEEGKFVHEDKVNQFLNNITTPDQKTNYPFSTKEFRQELRHTLWLMPGIREAAAMKELMERHPVFGMEYQIINVVDNGDSADDITSQSDLERVRSAITDHPENTKTITLTVRKLTTGVNVPEWTAVMFLSNTNSATTYLQAAFRAQTPFSNEALGMKTNCYIFDFAPDRALTVMVESNKMSSKAGKITTPEQKTKLSELLNFLPIIGEQGNVMKPYQVDTLLTKLKRVYAEKAVQSGFDDDSLYNDELLKITAEDLNEFKELKASIGTTKSEKKKITVDVNHQGLTDEEYAKAELGKKKQKKERTTEELEAISKMNALKKQRRGLISILRGISIRIPMMIYGLDIDIDCDVNIADFVRLIDNESWEEFMPKGVDKPTFIKFSKFYDADVFIEAGRIIRRKTKSYDRLDPLERVEKIATLFGTFKNPDKETVLTPWNVVNRHLASTIGGLRFFDETYTNTTNKGVNIRDWVTTIETNKVFNQNTHILEINSKTGLYPLYVAASLYWIAFLKLNESHAGKFSLLDEFKIWAKILYTNIFIIAKTPMAKLITVRTLAGYRKIKINAKYFDNIISEAKQSTDKTAKRIMEEFGEVKFDAVIGNPPYQSNDNGERDDGSANASASPIYNYFVEISKKISRIQTLIIPSRWLSGAGKGLNKFSKEMLDDQHLRSINIFYNGSTIFPKTDIKGGVLFFLRDTEYLGKTRVEFVDDVATYIEDKYLKNHISETFIPYPQLANILEKVNNRTDYLNNQNIQKIVSVLKPYGLRTDFFENQAKYLLPEIFAEADRARGGDPSKKIIKIIGLKNKRRTFRYVPDTYPIPIRTDNDGNDTVNTFKVFSPYAYGNGEFGETIPDPFIGYPGEIVTETFLRIGNFNSKVKATGLLKYMKTKFFRALVGILKTTQHSTTTYKLVPLQDFTDNSDIDWSKSVHEIDLQLYKKYGLDDDEINFIETKVKEMD